MALAQVVIVGRPNVGKSSLLNMLARERVSIVDPRAGITRDRVSTVIEHNERYFELVDTGGIGIVDDDHLEAHVEQQIEYAITRASLILFVLDVHDGFTALDQRIAARLRKLNKPLIVVANKVDAQPHVAEAAHYHALGLGEPEIVSALHTRGREDLLDRIVGLLGPATDEPPPPAVMKLAIVGKRNAGKSTLVNALAGEPRVIVSEIPGTTRDSVDVRFERDGRTFIAIDTAGVRKKKSMGDIDFYSYTRAIRSIERADVILYLIDATTPISDVDVKLAVAILEEYKPCVLAINKWDLVVGRATAGQYAEYLTGVLGMVDFAPVVLLTAKEGRNVQAAVDTALALHKQANTRVPTAKLNEALELILAQRGPSAKRGTKPVKLFYATQVDVAPPSIVFFCNAPELIDDNYRRFMENRLRELTPFTEVPMRLMFRSRRRDDETGGEKGAGRRAKGQERRAK